MPESENTESDQPDHARSVGRTDAAAFHAHGSSPLAFTGERVTPDEPGWEWCFQAHRFGYEDLCARVPAGARVLDIGCGEGYGVALLAARARFVVGLDYSEGTVRHARDRYRAAPATWVVADAQRLPFRTRSFDVVASLQVIEHFTDTASHVTDVARVLADDGFSYCATPNIALATPKEAANEFHLRDFTADDLAGVMRAHFEAVDLVGQFYRERSPRVRAMRAAEAATPRIGPRLARLERILARVPGPVRVRIRPPLRRLFGIPLVDAHAARNAIIADDFEARPPAEDSFCLISISRRPRRSSAR